LFSTKTLTELHAFDGYELDGNHKRVWTLEATSWVGLRVQEIMIMRGLCIRI